MVTISEHCTRSSSQNTKIIKMKEILERRPKYYYFGIWDNIIGFLKTVETTDKFYNNRMKKLKKYSTNIFEYVPW